MTDLQFFKIAAFVVIFITAGSMLAVGISIGERSVLNQFKYCVALGTPFDYCVNAIVEGE